ncbi:hypothetical protein XNC1_4002 [Xenorhabdus nematophila ATCC 19061]|uniref:Uncharacterized protein n=1 Tax=Xenorhabdus nematophila (strain ATCC 19061 / DSM 3370 / CCUG 14189 / LMG 1036 / NCIMB 9965 / AN6) TaxID=406817 RepID=D3VCJ2_XENNA|nr:hypothetical protein XNC1_4002 [Xenorhabdus nematophila ATCC 19061]
MNESLTLIFTIGIRVPNNSIGYYNNYNLPANYIICQNANKHILINKIRYLAKVLMVSLAEILAILSISKTSAMF